MAPEQENQENEGLRRRREREKRREAEKARRAMRLRLAAALIVVVAVAGLIAVFSRNAGNREMETTPSTTAQTMQATQEPGSTGTQPTIAPAEQSAAANGTADTETEVPQTTAPQPESIHIVAAGDLNITDTVVENGRTGEGYDFTEAFLDVAPILSSGDLTLLNFEGTLSGVPYGSEKRSAPPQMAQALADIGVDVVQTANSAAIQDGILGLQATIDALDSAGIRHLGTFYDSKDFRSTGGYTMVEVEGFRIALVAFTKGMDNLGLPEGSENCVNLLYTDYSTDYKKVDTDGINKVLRKVAEEQPDLTIAMLHWGSENNESISDTQRKIRSIMLSGGVDVILGTHSHLVQEIDFDPEAGTLVAYSLGDFYGDANMPGTNYSLILDLEVSRDADTGDARVVGYDYTPIYTLKPEESAAGGQRVVRIREAMARYETGYLGRVTDETYESMDYALTRLEERVTPAE